jgi:hypothetical protein
VTAVSLPFPPIPPVGHVTQMRAADPLFVGVFVEGPDDVEMWYRWLKEQPLPCNGCEGVRRAIEDIRNRGLKGCVGIIDADLSRVKCCLTADADIIVSEMHDHECDLACSRALDNLLLSLPQAETGLRALAAPHASMRDALRSRAFPFGAMRWVFQEAGVQYSSRMTPNNDQIFDRKTWALNGEAFIALGAQLLSMTPEAMEKEMARRQVPTNQEWSVCDGHDVIALLRIAFATVNCAAERCRSEKAVAWALRNSLDSSHLPAFSMWQQLKDWEARNAPFVARRDAQSLQVSHSRA